MLSPILQEHSFKPRNMGIPTDAVVIGVAGVPGEGPFLRLSLQLEGGAIADARFETYGCPIAIGCGSWLTGWVKGKTRAQAGVIEAGDLELVLGGLPLGKEHCAQLAVQALKQALTQIESENHNGEGERQ